MRQSLLVLILTLSLLCTGCELEEGNQRGYVISKTHELSSEDISDRAQP